jgi:hypothetical protein
MVRARSAPENTAGQLFGDHRLAGLWGQLRDDRRHRAGGLEDPDAGAGIGDDVNDRSPHLAHGVEELTVLFNRGFDSIERQLPTRYSI